VPKIRQCRLENLLNLILVPNIVGRHGHIGYPCETNGFLAMFRYYLQFMFSRDAFNHIGINSLAKNVPLVALCMWNCSKIWGTSELVI
jgi:hypothetical protein